MCMKHLYFIKATAEKLSDDMNQIILVKSVLMTHFYKWIKSTYRIAKLLVLYLSNLLH